MKRTIYTLLSVIFLIFIRITPVNAELIYENFNGIIYVKQATVAELENLFKKYHYTRFRGLKDYHIPAILINNMPTDYREIKSAKYRNELCESGSRYMLSPHSFHAFIKRNSFL